MKLGALLGVAATMINWTALWRAFMISCRTAMLWGNGDEASSQPVFFVVGRDAVLRQRVAGGALNVLDLARVKINEPKPWTTPTPLLSWSQSSDVRRESVLPLRRLASAVCRV